MSADAGEKTPRQRFGWLRQGLLGLFGLFYAYAVWNAVSYLIYRTQLGINATGSVTLIFAVIFPILVFVAALVLGRRRRLAESALLFLAGFGLVAVFWLDVVASTLRTIKG